MASGSSVWRGMDYYERKMVCSWKKSGEEAYDGVVSGSEGNKYSVHIDKVHPRNSHIHPENHPVIVRLQKAGASSVSI